MGKSYFFVFIVFLIMVLGLSGCNPYQSSSLPSRSPISETGQDFSPETSQETAETLREKNRQNQKANEQKENLPPTILITEPDQGDVLTSAKTTVYWKTTDGNNDELLISLEYRPEEGSWVYLADRIANDGSLEWDISALSNGEYEVRLSVTDGAEITYTSKIFVIAR